MDEEDGEDGAGIAYPMVQMTVRGAAAATISTATRSVSAELIQSRAKSEERRAKS